MAEAVRSAAAGAGGGLAVAAVYPLVDSFLQHPHLRARLVALGQDATPPGHQAF